MHELVAKIVAAARECAFDVFAARDPVTSAPSLEAAAAAPAGCDADVDAALRIEAALLISDAVVVSSGRRKCALLSPDARRDHVMRLGILLHPQTRTRSGWPE